MNKPLNIVFIAIGAILLGGILYSYFAPASSPSDNQMPAGPNANEPQLNLPEDLQRLAVDLQNAYIEKKVSAVLALFYMNGVDQATKDALQKTISSDFKYDFGAIEIAEPGKGNIYEYVQNDVKYRANLPVTYKLAIHFKENKDRVTVAPFYVGEHEGKYYLVTAAPVGKQ